MTFTAGLARDPECTVLVVDLPDGANDGTLQQMAQEIPPGKNGLRLVFGRPPRLGAAIVARRLADLLGRTVIAAAGVPLPTPGGGLFIGADGGPGWVRCEPGTPEAWDSRRFPKPSWESALPARPWSLGTVMAEPLPFGVWLRPAEQSALRHDHHRRLSGQLRVSSELMTVAVGAPEAAALPMADIARFWRDVPPHVRPAVRFMCYGPTRLSGGRHFGDVLAQVVGEPVRLYNGMPEGRDDSGDVLLVGGDGSPGRPLQAHEFAHMPPTDTAEPLPSPLAMVHRWPLGDLQEIRPGIHLLTDDVVVEVVRSGLWVRLLQAPSYAAEVRAADPDPGHERILCDADSKEALPRLRRLAKDLVWSLPSELRRAVRTGVCRPTAPAGDRAPDMPVRRPGRSASSPARPSPRGPGVAGRPPAPNGSRPVPSGGQTGQARLYTTPDSGHQELLSLAAEVLRRHPELTANRSDLHAVAGLAAVLRHVTGVGPNGPGEETATSRPEPPDSELLREGLRMLPVHRGATGLRATLDDAMRQWYAAQPLLVDANVCEASVLGPRDDPGNTDFLIWSVDGRRTDLLDPLRPDRVLFLPGSRFRILRTEPDTPGVIMMREIGPEMTPMDQGLDQAAVRRLIQAWRDWRGDARS
ncbi:hypothetical protein [Streptomyces sp.]|uniref:hypothetical protein n=1 Tax=Streptomyces sp. TaxID=1931 RepID=UPI002F3FBB79